MTIQHESKEIIRRNKE